MGRKAGGQRGGRRTHQVYFGLVAHITLDFGVAVRVFAERKYTVDVVPPEAVDDGLDRLERTLVEDEVALEDVHCQAEALGKSSRSF